MVAVRIGGAGLGRGQGHAGTGRDDLAPAEPVRERCIGEVDTVTGRERRIERGRELAHDAHRVQATDAVREGEPCLVEGERAPRSVNGERQARLERRAGRRAPGVGFGVGDLAVAVGVEAEACLEGRDLRLVDHDVEQDPVGLDPNAGVVVDGEVAERMRRGERRDDECGAQPGQGGEAAEASAVSGPVVHRHVVASQRMRHLVEMDARAMPDRISATAAK